ncbi:MAG: hypothetical protein EOP40_03160 [Rubrivivax sp.]|nr:MAG: hypothetical protein EOP40_03160 [Rubrivivax sp.]
MGERQRTVSMMHKKNWIVWAAAAAVAVAGALAWAPWRAGSPDAAAPAAPGVTAGAGPLVVAPALSSSAAVGATGTGREAEAAVNPLDTMIQPVFRATATGGLALDAQTRIDVERIESLYERDEALARLNEASGALPDKARRELAELYQQHAQYAQAVAQTYPPGQGGESIDDAARQLNGLHELRQQYFGAERAEALFGEEERISRELLALMRQSKDPGLSLEEKAAQAQEAWKKAHPAQQ